MADTSAAREPRTADTAAARGLIVECVTGHAFSQLHNVPEWS